MKKVIILKLRYQSNMNNSVYILEDRAILYINGEDAKDFLTKSN